MAKKNKSMENYMENVENLVKSRVVFKKKYFWGMENFSKNLSRPFWKIIDFPHFAQTRIFCGKNP